MNLYESYLRPEDQWAAVCYAHGIYADNLPHYTDVKQQVGYIQKNATRIPQHVLEIGSGRGEVSVMLDHLGIKVQSIDVNSMVDQYHRATAQLMFGQDPNHSLFIGDLDTTFDALALDTVDTILLVETIEHIFADEWTRFYNKVKPLMVKNSCHLIITNEKWYWPLGHEGDCNEHVALINNAFYDQLAADSKQTLYRQTSHLSLEF